MFAALTTKVSGREALVTDGVHFKAPKVISNWNWSKPAALTTKVPGWEAPATDGLHFQVPKEISKRK